MNRSPMLATTVAANPPIAVAPPPVSRSDTRKLSAGEPILILRKKVSRKQKDNIGTAPKIALVDTSTPSS